MSRRGFLAIVSVLAGLTCAGPALGQEAPMHGELRCLVTNARVQDDIGLEGPQKERVGQVAKRLQGRTAVHKEQEEELRTILKPDQMRRLKEIRWQVLDAEAVFDDEVGQALRLTGEQKERLAHIRRENQQDYDNMFELMKRIRFRSPKARQEFKYKYIAKARERTRKALDEILTPQQEQALRKLRGKEFAGVKDLDLIPCL